ncbi:MULTISPECIES: hypothetical protein [Catenuloplanes]|uniref:Uncharacterized protein n=1 Tax=Catenuloplanes niger TaxID=587534 RepID=A0AAE3ZX28_9ACTN|nr:hypothetical protein [Catenuloplanes niger]MDR7326507.1 hypothetical protein [Catenuloplanes niger]
MRSRILLTISAHVAGAVAAWVLFCLECGLLYLGLLVSVLGIVADPGGPLHGPVTLLLVAVTGAVLTIAVLLPAVLIGRMARRFSWPAALAIAAVLLALLVAALRLTTDPLKTWAVLAGAAATPLTLWCAIVSLATRRPPEEPPADNWWFTSQP